MKSILFFVILMCTSIASFSQDQTVVIKSSGFSEGGEPIHSKLNFGDADYAKATFTPLIGDYPGVLFAVDSTEYDYFAAYIAIQTSEVTNSQLEFTKKLMKYVKQNHGVLYITIQSGTPPCIPTPTQPCPKN